MNTLLELKSKLSPTEFSNHLKSKGAIYWDPREEFWVVTDYRLAETVLKSPDFSAERSSYFATRMRHISPAQIGNFFEVAQRMMVASDPPHHTARRKLGAHGISDQAIEDFLPAVQKTVGQLLEKIKNKTHVDFVAEVAKDLPSVVLADLFGVPEENREDFYKYANDMTQFFGAGSGCPMHQATDANQGALKLKTFFHDMIRKRKAVPKKDFISRLLQHQESLGLDDDEVVSQAIMMLVAGKVTTTDQISNVLNELLGAKINSEYAWDHLQKHPESLAAAIEEATRLDPAVNFVFRVVRQATQVGESHLPAGSVVFISVHAITHRAPACFAPHASAPASATLGRNTLCSHFLG